MLSHLLYCQQPRKVGYNCRSYQNHRLIHLYPLQHRNRRQFFSWATYKKPVILSIIVALPTAKKELKFGEPYLYFFTVHIRLDVACQHNTIFSLPFRSFKVIFAYCCLIVSFRSCINISSAKSLPIRFVTSMKHGEGHQLIYVDTGTYTFIRFVLNVQVRFFFHDFF